MVLAGSFRRRSIERNFIIRHRSFQAFSHGVRKIVGGRESKAAALDGQHLQRQISRVHLAKLGHPLEELLVVRIANDVARGACGIHAVERDLRLEKAIGEPYQILEYLFLLFWVE